MTREVVPEASSLALNAAKSLKQLLEQRLIGNTVPGWSCNCGACNTGPSKITHIRMPTTHQHHIGDWFYWSCRTVDDSGKSLGRGLSEYIHPRELFVMFRNHFAGLNIETAHPHARLCYDKVDDLLGDEAAKQGRKFTPSGQTVVVSEQSAAYVRPKGDLTNSVWVNAEIRIDSNLENYALRGALLACNIDPFEFGQRQGRGASQYYNRAQPCQLPTLYVHISADAHEGDVYFAIARLVATNEATGEVTFELDQSVELFNPAAN